MNPSQFAELQAEFIRRSHAEKAAGDNLTASTWQLAASLLIQAASNSQPEPLRTSKELGSILGVSFQTVTRWADEGKIPAAVKEPGCLRFDLAEVRKALAARAAEAVKHQYP